ncbi:SAM-dependent methyltransferase [Spirillospora sp. NPDC050679]
MDDGTAPPGIDPAVASPARVYDHLLGGKDNFEADRAVADMMIKAFPETREVLRENRRFLVRAVRCLAAEHGVRRFLDIGSGLPTQDNVHQVAQRSAPGSQTVYVDNDPMVTVHARALLDAPGTAVIHGDLRRPEDILAEAAVRDLLATDEPVALLLVAVLHFIKDSEDPYGLVKRLVEALPPGSFLVLSHGTDLEAESAEVARGAYRRNASADLTLRPLDGVAPFFDGLELLDPGLVWAKDWRPDDASTGILGVYAGVARR